MSHWVNYNQRASIIWASILKDQSVFFQCVRTWNFLFFGLLGIMSKKKWKQQQKKEEIEYHNYQNEKRERGKSTHVRPFPELHIWIGPRVYWLQDWEKFTNLPTHAVIPPGLIAQISFWRCLNILPEKLRHNILPFYCSQVKEESLLKILFIWFWS